MSKKRKKRKKNSIGKFVKAVFDLGLFLLVVLVITLLLSKFVVERIEIHNHSMENTVMNEDSVLIDKISYRFIEPKRFDIIVFKQTGTGEVLIKRIVGLPHETIEIKDGVFYINDEPIKDVPGLEAPEEAGIARDPVLLTEGEYFVVGDNRAESIDSRYEEIGMVTSNRIIGRLLMRIWPLTDFKVF